LISSASDGEAITLDLYLKEIARTMSESLLDGRSDIKIEIEAAGLEIDPVRAVPFGLLVNELATNAIEHAFRNGTGRVLLSAMHGVRITFAQITALGVLLIAMVALTMGSEFCWRACCAIERVRCLNGWGCLWRLGGDGDRRDARPCRGQREGTRLGHE
jgi:hypothetical protein